MSKRMGYSLLCFMLLLLSACAASEIRAQAVLSQPVKPLFGSGGATPHPLPESPPLVDMALPVVTPTPAPVYTARIAFTGDLMVHDKQLESAYRKDSGTYLFTGFEEIAPYLTVADYTVGNLETTFAGADAIYATYPAFNTPDSFAQAVKDAGFTFVTTANNHCYDRREKGLLRTLDILDGLGLEHAGTYASQEAQGEVFIKEINNIRFAFLPYTYSTNGIPVAADKPWLVNLLDENLMRRQIAQARQAGAEVVIVLPHMGNEYEEKPSAAFTTLARNLCAWGADAVMASHPHVLQPTEVFEITAADGSTRTCFIAYSMGNFISSQRTVPRDAGAVFYLDFEKTFEHENGQVRLKSASFAPTWVKFIHANGRYDIRVLPVHDTLAAVAAGEAQGLRPQDVNRLRAVHRETTKKMLGGEVPSEVSLPVYQLYGEEPGD